MLGLRAYAANHACCRRLRLTFAGQLLLDLRRDLLFWPQQNVYPNICDPTRLTVGRGNGLETPPAHQQQVPRLRLVERLPSTQTQRRLALVRIACGELSYTLPRRNTVGVLQVIQFEVSLGAVADPTKVDPNADCP
jgi:hypothetical protein